ncbi:class I SAM-dependent methyltransferase [Polaromonas sp. CT11-55]|uniref:class I SAM-dependent methyltransferase n=1 Tax=Polaromonas sp. CT11-55 TaxID=3243045 RepID=UPI0039A4895F
MTPTADQTKEFSWTGERFVPFLRGDIELEHLHRYAFARDFTAQKDVLDIACGEGYGSYFLAGTAKTVVGVDLSEIVIQHARSKYAAPGLEFLQGDCTRIPLKDSSVDVVVSFETIEHHDQHEAMLAEIKRVLRPNGVVVISTPEKHLLNELAQDRNEYHVKELSLGEFTELLAGHFKHSAFFSQRVRHGSLMTPMVASEGGGVFSFHTGSHNAIVSSPVDPQPLFLVAVISDSDLPPPRISFFDGTDFFYRDRESQLAKMTEDRDALAAEIGRVKATLSWQLTKPLRLFQYLISRLLGLRAPRA